MMHRIERLFETRAASSRSRLGRMAKQAAGFRGYNAWPTRWCAFRPAVTVSRTRRARSVLPLTLNTKKRDLPTRQNSRVLPWEREGTSARTTKSCVAASLTVPSVDVPKDSRPEVQVFISHVISGPTREKMTRECSGPARHIIRRLNASRIPFGPRPLRASAVGAGRGGRARGVNPTFQQLESPDMGSRRCRLAGSIDAGRRRRRWQNSGKPTC